MTKYHVTLTKEIWYTARIEADSEDEAEQKAWDLLQEKGIRLFKRDGEEWVETAYVEEQL